MSTPTVSFSDLSKNSKRVADTVERAQRVHVTRRDGEDLYLTTERHDRQREDTADVTARLFTALIGSDEGARRTAGASRRVPLGQAPLRRGGAGVRRRPRRGDA
ncbi:hypothetical protein ACFWXO_19925 [Kitasatospora sp. NPDC059088]|uniref:hypothetical protein n=1 Tax=Kitasatospora sp. NPDC059088 TaxID=3346722 RepID=UPI00367E0989